MIIRERETEGSIPFFRQREGYFAGAKRAVVGKILCYSATF